MPYITFPTSTRQGRPIDQLRSNRSLRWQQALTADLAARDLPEAQADAFLLGVLDATEGYGGLPPLDFVDTSLALSWYDGVEWERRHRAII